MNELRIDESELAVRKDKKKGLSTIIRVKSLRPRTETMKPKSQHLSSHQSSLPNLRPRTFNPSTDPFVARREERQSHWRVNSSEARTRLPDTPQKHVPLGKLDLPFVEGCGHIGSRFSVNTLMKAVETVNLNDQQTTYQRMRSDFKSTLPQNRPSMVAKIKGPYQPRSVLTRTRDAYGLGTRKKSKKKLSDRADELSDGADSDDSSISPAYHDQSFDTKSEYDSTRLNSLSHQMPMSQSRFGLQSVQEEESYQTDYPTYHHDLSRSPHDTRLFQGEEHRYTKDTPMDHLETWVASALQDPTFLNQPSPSTGQKGFAPTDPSRSGSFGVSAALPHQSGFNPHTTSTYPLRDPVSSQQIPTHQPAYQAYAPSPLNLPKPTTPLNIRKSIAKSPPSQSAFATSTAPSTARHQPPTTPGRPTLVAQPWSRVRNNQARSLPHQPSTPHQASSRPRIASTSHLPSILKTSAPPPRRPSAPSHYIPTSARSPTFPVESPHTKLDHQHRQTNQGHRLMAPPPGLMGESSNAFETPRRAPAQPSGFKAFCAPFLRT